MTADTGCGQMWWGPAALPGHLLLARLPAIQCIRWWWWVMDKLGMMPATLLTYMVVDAFGTKSATCGLGIEEQTHLLAATFPAAWSLISVGRQGVGKLILR